MVSIVGQLSLTYVPFDELVHPETMVTKVRMIETNSDYHQNSHGFWKPVPRAQMRGHRVDELSDEVNLSSKAM